MPPKAKYKACTSKVKSATGEVESCDGIIENREGRDLLCTSKKRHITKLKTGHCSNGWHEGLKAQSYTGAAVPTCKFWETCPCDCHTAYDRMFAEMGMDRKVQENSGYHVVNPFVMPERVITEADPVLSSDGAPIAQLRYESPAPGIVPAAMTRAFAPTPSGRAARGELEADVKRAVDVFIIENEAGNCTPVWISEEIARAKGIKAPSTGAVTAVLDRWVSYGFAETAKKPTRFVRYTPDGLELGLDVLKDRYKRRTRMAETAQKLGRRV